MDLDDIKNEIDQSSSTGTMTAQIGNSAPYTYTKVSLHSFGAGEGGYIGGSSGLVIFTAVGYPANLGDGQHTARYPKDFQKQGYVIWAHKSGDREYQATDGKITLTFSNGQTKVYGNYKFSTEDGTIISGEFDIDNQTTS
jgi:hypothetical protein